MPYHYTKSTHRDIQPPHHQPWDDSMPKLLQIIMICCSPSRVSKSGYPRARLRKWPENEKQLDKMGKQ